MFDLAQWKGFTAGEWQTRVDVRDFIQKNYTPYTGDDAFLAPPTARTKAMMDRVNALFREEQERGGVWDIDTETVSSLCHYAPGYIDRENERIVGLQTDEPLKRGVSIPFGGIRMAREACKAYGYTLSDGIEKAVQFRTTHNDGVFRVYTDEMKAARHCGLHHRSARRLRPRAHHRRLPPRRPLRHRRADTEKSRLTGQRSASARWTRRPSGC